MYVMEFKDLEIGDKFYIINKGQICSKLLIKVDINKSKVFKENPSLDKYDKFNLFVSYQRDDVIKADANN